MLAIIPVGGYTGAAMRFVTQGLADENHGYIRGFIRHSTRIVIGSSIVIALVGCLVVMNVSGMTGEMRGVLLTAFIGVPFLALIKLEVGLANAFSWFALSFIPNNVVRPLLFLAGIFLSWHLTQSLESGLAMRIHVAAIVLVTALLTLLLYGSIRKQLLPAPPTQEASLWNRTASSLLLLGVFANYFPEFTVIMIGFFLPSEEIAIYNAGYRIALLTSFGLFAVDAFVAPALARFYRKGLRSELLQVVRLATKLRFLVALCAMVLFVALGKYILALFGEEFVTGYKVLLILSLAQLSIAAVGPSMRLLSISGFQNQGLYASVLALALWALIAIILVPLFGITGAAVSAFFSLTVWSFALRYFVMQNLGIDPLILARDLRQ
jgi:O-antigen/teichoic acid export membrane protein